VRIRVTDSLGSPVSAATASLVDANDRPVGTLPANRIGAILWTNLPFGHVHFEVRAPGFELLQLTVSDREERTLEARLKIGCLECVVPDVETVHMPNPEALDPPAPPPQPQTAKRLWWQVFH
jgi:hypothetical protein